MLTASIEASGREVEACGDALPAPEAGVVNLVVAPHEFFILQDGPPEADIVRSAFHSITVGMEQPGTVWFEEGARYASYGPLALDINPQGVRELQRRGIEAHRLQLGYHPGWDVWGGRNESARGNDVLFLGALTPRREEFLARSAQALSEWECDLRLFEVSRPVSKGSDHFVTGRRKHELLADSRVLLNIHQGERDYFEWVRVIEAISNGCLVVTETSDGYAPLVPAEHLVQGGLASLTRRMDDMLRDEDLRAEVADRSYHFIREHLAMVDSIDEALGWLEHRVAASPLRPPLRRPAVPSEFRRPGRRKSVPPPDSSTLDDGSSSTVRGERQVLSLLQGLLWSEIDTARSIGAIRSAIEYGTPNHIDTIETPSYAAADPEVSVVVPLLDCEHGIRTTIESIVATEHVALELVLIDDHSSDESVPVAREVMHEFESVPIRLVTQSATRGVAHARNLGFEHARSEFVFLMDVAGAVYPQGIGRLLDALRRSDAAFSYGIIERQGDVPGLASYLPWDVHRLTEANYIDSMSLIRKSAWRSIGGFDVETDGKDGGDNYDFWLHLAAEGQHGQLVTNVVGRSGPRDVSLRPRIALEADALTEYYRTKHRHLPWPDGEKERRPSPTTRHLQRTLVVADERLADSDGSRRVSSDDLLDELDRLRGRSDTNQRVLEQLLSVIADSAGPR